VVRRNKIMLLPRNKRRKRMATSKKSLPVRSNITCARKIAEKEVAAESVEVEEETAAEVAATFRTRMALVTGRLMMATLKRSHHVSSVNVDLVANSKKVLKNRKRARLLPRRRKEARASHIESIGVNVAKIEVEEEEESEEDPEGVAALVVEAIVRKRALMQPKMKKILKWIREPSKKMLTVKEIVRLVAAAEVVISAVEDVAEPVPQMVTSNLSRELMANNLSAEEVEEAVVATEKTVEAIKVSITVRRPRAMITSLKHTRASTTKMAKSINKSSSKTLERRVPSMLALIRDLRRPRLISRELLSYRRSKALTASLR